MIELNWNPVPYLGPIPINWYGINYALAFLVGWRLVSRWAPKYDIPREKTDGLMLSIVLGTIIGARLTGDEHQAAPHEHSRRLAHACDEE